MPTTTPWLSLDRLIRIGLAGALLLATFIAQAGVTDPFKADFRVKRDSLPLGTTSFSLQSGDKPGCFVYTGRAHPNAIVRVFIGQVTDESRFCIDDDGTLRSQYFRHHIDGKPEDSYTLDFDWEAGEVIYASEAGKRNTMPLGERALDPASIQIAARQWVASAAHPDELGEASFAMVDENETKTYRLRASPAGDIDTPGGRFDTLLVERVDNPKRHLRFWLARYADWIPVRVEHQKADGAIFRMNLTDLHRPQR